LKANSNQIIEFSQQHHYRKGLFLMISFLFVSLSMMAQAQSTGVIAGKIIDKETQEPVSQANVRILKQGDSTFVTGKASDEEGVFTIPVRYGSYIVQISYVGYNDVYQNVQVTSSRPNVQLGNIILNNDNILLSEAVITAKAPEIVVKGDTLEYNADSYKVTESAVVEDLLKKMPGVEIDSEGKITVNGKEIKNIGRWGRVFQ